MKHISKSKHVTYDQLIRRLMEEQSRLEDATFYRRDTAKQAINVVKARGNANFFLSEKEVLPWLTQKFSRLDNEKAKDITKYIRVITNDIIRQQTMSPEMRQRIKMRKTKQLTFEKMK